VSKGRWLTSKLLAHVMRRKRAPPALDECQSA
jgi:hypothetical protein